jgi:hypothetical protein
VVDVGDDAEVPNLRRRGEGLVGETADGNLLVKPGLGASRVSADGGCGTIAVEAGSGSASPDSAAPTAKPPTTAIFRMRNGVLAPDVENICTLFQLVQ